MSIKTKRTIICDVCFEEITHSIRHIEARETYESYDDKLRYLVDSFTAHYHMRCVAAAADAEEEE